MASSAVYRYVASRDDLLTRLIVDAYDSIGAAAEAAEDPVDRADLFGRFAAACVAVRTWAHANPNEYALIYGSPVPGYAAPVDTVAPASRVTRVLAQILVDAVEAGALAPSPTARPAEAAVVTGLGPVRPQLPAGLPDEVVQRGLLTWLGLFGYVSFELFGQFHNVIAEEPGARDAFFAACVQEWAAQLGLAPS